MTAYSPEVERMMKRLFASLKEDDRRRYAAIEAAVLGHGGIESIASVLGCDPKTNRAKLEGEGDLNTGRSRKKGVDANNWRSIARDDHFFAVPEGESRDLPQVPFRGMTAGLQRPDEFERGRLPLTTDDHVHRSLVGEDASGVVGRVDAAIDGDHGWAAGLDRPEHADASRMGGCRSSMTGHDYVRTPSPDLVPDFPEAQAAAFGVLQPHLMTGVDEGTADHEQPERDLVAHPVVRGDGLIRGIDEENLHEPAPRLAWVKPSIPLEPQGAARINRLNPSKWGTTLEIPNPWRTGGLRRGPHAIGRACR